MARVPRSASEIEAVTLAFTASVKTTRRRVITAPGEERLAALLRERRQASLSAELVDATNAGDLTSLLDLLAVRRAIEPEGVRHTVLKASDAEIETVGSAMDFHRSLAEASPNSVLVALASILLDPVNDRLAHLQRRISTETGDRPGYVTGHQRISRHLRAHDSIAAERAMRDHIDRMIAEVERYQSRLSVRSLPRG